jgi:hypothetical protein
MHNNNVPNHGRHFKAAEGPYQELLLKIMDIFWLGLTQSGYSRFDFSSAVLTGSSIYRPRQNVAPA